MHLLSGGTDFRAIWWQSVVLIQKGENDSGTESENETFCRRFQPVCQDEVQHNNEPNH